MKLEEKNYKDLFIIADMHYACKIALLLFL